MRIEKLGKFRPPAVSCAVCRELQHAQGLGYVYAVSFGKLRIQLCSTHLTDLGKQAAEVAVIERMTRDN